MSFCHCWRRWRNTSVLFTKPWSGPVESLLLPETQNHRLRPSKNKSGRLDMMTMNMLNLIVYQVEQQINTLSSLFPQFPQDLLNQQQSCKRCLSVIERNHHTLQKALSSSKVLRNFDLSLLQKRVAEIQGSAQVSVKYTCT